MSTNRTALFSRVQPGGVFTVESLPEHPGAIWFVGSAVTGATDAAGYGKSPDKPFATLDYSIASCTANAGDVIYVLPGHSETLTTAVTVDIAGVSIIGLGNGLDRPEFTVGANGIDGITVTADNVRIENLYFNEATVATATANINIAAANAVVRRVHMDMGANDRDGFTLTAAAERVTIEDCSLVVTADGPDTWITFEGVIDLPILRRNYIIASDGTNALDDGVLDFGALAITNPIVVDNVFDGSDQVVSVLDDVGAVVGDCFGGNKYAGSATDGDTVTLAAASIANDGITAAKIAADAIGAAEIADGAIDAATFAAGAINAAAVATGAIDADALAADAVAEIADGVADEALAAHKTANTVGDALSAVERCIEKSDGAVLNGADDLFTIAGGPIEVLSITGVVTTIIGAGATNVKLQITTTEPAATVDMNAGTVDIDSDAAGTSYRTINTTGIFTPVTAGFVLKANSFATNDTSFLCPIGTIKFLSDAARTGNIKWYLRYRPLSPNSVVTAAA